MSLTAHGHPQNFFLGVGKLGVWGESPPAGSRDGLVVVWGQGPRSRRQVVKMMHKNSSTERLAMHETLYNISGGGGGGNCSLVCVCGAMSPHTAGGGGIKMRTRTLAFAVLGNSTNN